MVLARSGESGSTDPPLHADPAASWTVSTVSTRSRDGCATVADYARHEPEKSLLHDVIRGELVPFLARARGAGAPFARFVEREVRAYLDCGVLAYGFLRMHCDACGHDRPVASSCKVRGFCPSCGGRRMANTAAHLVDRVLPEVPVRQWVLTLLCPLRYCCAWNARLTSGVLRAILRAVCADQRLRARKLFGIRTGQCGSVTLEPAIGRSAHEPPLARAHRDPGFGFDQSLGEDPLLDEVP